MHSMQFTTSYLPLILYTHTHTYTYTQYVTLLMHVETLCIHYSVKQLNICTSSKHAYMHACTHSLLQVGWCRETAHLFVDRRRVQVSNTQEQWCGTLHDHACTIVPTVIETLIFTWMQLIVLMFNSSIVCFLSTICVYIHK